jgi:hypothetical protein
MHARRRGGSRDGEKEGAAYSCIDVGRANKERLFFFRLLFSLLFSLLMILASAIDREREERNRERGSG